MALPPIVEGLTAVWGSCSDANQSGYLRIIASFGDHRASPGVPDQQNRTFLLTKRAYYGLNGFCTAMAFKAFAVRKGITLA